MNAASHLLPVYRRSAIAMVRGQGAYLFDDAGKRYLDFASGIAVNALGHCHPHVVAALKDQAETLWHCSNLYRIPGAETLAARLAAASFADKVFFCSSGAEAVEAGIKCLRRYHHMRGQGARNRIITFAGGFHGRTYAGISAGGNESAREGYAPLLPGFDRVAYGDIAAVKAALTPETAGVLIEAVQGEGGVRAATPAFLRDVRALCDARGLVLMIDEVQCGMGRTGALFAFEHAGIEPDIAATAKGIGNGFPLAATLVSAQVAECMTPGSHGSTYGANPLAMRVGNAVMDVLLTPGFFARVGALGIKMRAMLERAASAFPEALGEVRGIGLMLGLETRISNYGLAERLRAHGLLTAPCAGDSVIRFLPPLIIEEAHIEEASRVLHRVLGEAA